MRISVCSTVCVNLSWSGLILTAVEQTAQGRRSVSTGRRRNLLRSPHKHCSRALNRLCFSWQLQLMALSSVQLSSTHHSACAAVPWAFAINSVADAETICSSFLCTHSLSRFAVFTCSVLQWHLPGSASVWCCASILYVPCRCMSLGR